MVKTKNIIAALGVVAGFGVAALPLSSYAADPENPQTSSQVVRATVAQVFELTVTPNITISKEDTTQTLAVDKDSANTSLEHVINVSGNAYSGYTLTMGSNNAYDSLRHVVDETKTFGDADRYDANINIPAGTSVAAGTSSWAYRKSEDALSQAAGGIQGDYSNADWTKVKANTATADILKANTNTSHTAFDNTVYVNFGVATSEDQAAGVYEGEVIYTATATF